MFTELTADMRAVIQRVLECSVKIDGKEYSKTGHGLLVLVCVENGDSEADIDYIERKLLNLRIFNDENEKMNLSILDVKGEMMLVSQFTLLGDARRGTRPSYSNAAPPDVAIPMYERLKTDLSKSVPLKCGVFGADMKISLINDGPVTILLDSRKII